MFGGYAKQMHKQVERIILSRAPPEAAIPLMAELLTFMRADAEDGRLNIVEFAKQAKRQKFSHQEAALALIDFVVTRMKEVAAQNSTSPGGEAIGHISAVLEHVIDAEYNENGGRVVLRNGQIGRVMSSPRMSRFIKDGK